MAITATDPSVGINSATGGTITGWAHVQQSLRDMFLTRFGSRLMREWYGSFVPEALGRNISRSEMLPVIASITSAIEQWEPRFLVVDVVVDGTAIRSGALVIIIKGQYRPRALLGDLTVEGERRMTVDMSAEGMNVR